MKRSYFIFCVLFAALLQCIASRATIRLPQLVGNGMVLQRNVQLPIWGWGSPNEKITIRFKGHDYHTRTSVDGNWQVTLPKMAAGGPYEMEISGENSITLHDILIGDVWFCSGQSNMTIKMERVKEKYPEEIEQANFPSIRYFFVPTLADVQKEHADLPPGKWVRITKQNILDIGAVPFFFAKKLYVKYRIPIGIINSSVGGTPIQAWIGADSLKKFSNFATRLNQFKDSAFMERTLHKSNEATAVVRHPVSQDEGLSEDVKWYNTDYHPRDWHNFWLPGYWADQGVRNLNGVVWFRKEITVPAEMAGKPAKLYLGRIINADEAYVNGRLVGNTTYEYPPRRYDVPAGLLVNGKNIIVVRVTNTAGKGGFVPDKKYALTDGSTSIDLRGDWIYRVGQVFSPGRMRGMPAEQPFVAQNEPTALYNTMVAPALKFPIKGLIWYQGESNIGTQNYNQLLETLINSWRTAWHLGDTPFLIVQLPNFGDVEYSPAESSWAEIRDAQLQASKLKNTAITVNIDLGEWNDIHPLDKADVGNRLALAAEKLAYGDQKIVSSGPVFQSASIQGNHITIRFSNVGGGLASRNGEPLSQFAVAGTDRHFVWATAQIQGDSIILGSPEIQHPVYVRYAWADNPEGANLINVEGLPASPFKTDLP